MGERADVMGKYRQPGDPEWQAATSESAEPEAPELLRADIAQTRDEMSGTIDAIQEKLNPDKLKEQVTEAVQEQLTAAKEHVTEAVQEQVDVVKSNIHDATIGRAEQMVSNVGRSGLVETIKQNPVPAALAALGLGWLWMQRSSGSSEHRSDYRIDYRGDRPSYRGGQMYGGGTSYGYGRGQGSYGHVQEYHGSGQQGDDESLGDKVGNVTGQARDKVGDATSQAKDKVADVADQAREQVGQFADQAQDQVGEWTGQVQYGAQRARTRFDQTLYENPLAVSAAAIAVGLAVGLSLPETPVEDRLMGEARDNVMEKAQSAAQDTMQKVGQVAQQVQQTATETAKDAAQKQGLTSSGASGQGNQQQGGASTAMPKPPMSQQGTQSQPTTH